MFTPEGESPITKGLGAGEGAGLKAGGNWEGSGVCLTTGEVVHTSPQTHMPYFRPIVWGGAAHLWGQTGSHSRGCGSRGRRHAGTQRERETSQLGSFPICSLPPPSIITHPCPAHLSVTPSSQGLPAPLAPQTGSVPISAQRHHLLSWWGRDGSSRGRAGRPTYLVPPPCPLMPILHPSLLAFCCHLPK